MESFVYDYYGYNVKPINNGSFDYQGYHFKLISTVESETNIAKLEEIMPILLDVFQKDIVYFVKNRYNQYISINESTNLILLTYKIGDIGLDKIIKMHFVFNNYKNYYLNLKDIQALWEQRMDYVENQCLVSLNFDNSHHKDLYESAQFALGMGENALQYLSDLIIDFKVNFPSTLTHRRLKRIDKWEVFNPFNLIFDHSSRDLSELYKNDLIDLNTLITLTRQYNYQVYEYQYLLARILFPSAIFDIVEDIYVDKNMAYSKEIYKAINDQNNHLKKAKEYYIKINQIVSLRPIRWLETI